MRDLEFVSKKVNDTDKSSFKGKEKDDKECEERRDAINEIRRRRAADYRGKMHLHRR